MRDRFVEGTNKQYSVREDGLITRHFTNRYSINEKKVLTIFNDVIIHPNDRNNLRINGSSINIPKLLRKTFGFTYCNSCNDKIYDNSKGRRTRNTCDKCLVVNQDDYHKKAYLKRRVLTPLKLLTDKQKRINHKKSNKKWISKNPEKYKEKIIKFNRLKVDNITKSYTADCLKLPVSLIDEKLLKLKRQQLLLHRELKKQKQNDTN